ncbi:hypothetical protein I0C86_12320 [Plantactinospora sp. S1510]|uniref:Integral membrane protein n=1 Tax=Plantactinospora alkalitolerans TaxID=2789879 RepID=A0ABS0GU59_9ACTN|nr:hypothetical protein [Plantactinospora alkalitolerans]MBF9129737.1 hypothetical protein [Plantactinospora alkalitolerans]
MGILSKISQWRAKVFVWVGLPILVGIGVLTARDLVPAWQARSGGGTAGVFTAVQEDCSGRDCSWHGDFVSEDGTRRASVILYDAPEGLGEGDTTAARDTGARKGVFSEAGGSTWLLVTGLTLAGGVAAGVWVTIVLRTVRRRREASQDRVAAGAVRDERVVLPAYGPDGAGRDRS